MLHSIETSWKLHLERNQLIFIVKNIFNLIHLYFSTLTSLGSQTEILRVRASDDTFRKLKDNFTKLDKEKEKKS